MGLTSGNTPVLRVDHSRFGHAPLGVFGDGMIAALHIAMLLSAEPADQVLLLDEFDASLGVSALRRLAAFLFSVSDRSQIFLTTHREDTLDALLHTSDAQQRLALFQTSAPLADVEIRRFDPVQLDELRRDLGFDIRWPA